MHLEKVSNLDTLNSKNYTDKALGHGEGSLALLKYTVAIDTSISKKLWVKH